MAPLTAYKYEVLSQFLLVATILGGLSLSGLLAILTGQRRDRLHGFLFASLALASLAFLFATSLDTVLLPALKFGTKENGLNLLALFPFVIYSVILGTLALITAIGGMGFGYSRRCGIFVLVAAFLTFTVFAYCAWRFDRIASNQGAETKPLAKELHQPNAALLSYHGQQP